jgi:hypothetical protein
MSAHTPAPWEVFDDEIVARNTDVHIADVPLEDNNPTEWQANLRLITAAPDMFSALKALRDTSERLCIARADGDDQAWADAFMAHMTALAIARNVINAVEGVTV